MDSKPSIPDLLSFSWEKTKTVLFPFRLKRWLKILVIVWLAGHAATSGGNLNLPRQLRPQQEPTQAQTSARPQDRIPKEAEPSEMAGIPQAGPRGEAATQTVPPRIPVGFLVIFMILGVLIGLLFLWLSARFNFILLDLMVHGNVSIKEGFGKHRSLGNSYFLWSLGFIAFAILTLFILGLTAALLWAIAKFLLWVFIPLILIFAMGLAVIGILVVDFVLPMMYRDQMRIAEAIKKFLALKPASGQIAFYFLTKLGLGIVAGILVAVLAIAIGIPVLLISFVIALPGGWMYSAVPFLQPVLILLGVLFALVLIALLILLIGLLSLPIPIFFRAFALSFLVRLSDQYNLLDYHPPGT